MLTGRSASLALAALLSLLVTAGPAAAQQPAAAPAAARLAAPPSNAELAAEPARHDATREQFYFVLPDRFANGDPSNDRGGLTGSRLVTGYDPTDKGFYQGGDLAGLTERLDYIKGLGTTAIWMAPIFKNRPVQGTGENASAGYHGYWITDFTQVDPHFGTNADLEELVDQAHAKGMKVFFDVITNHTADGIDYREKAYEYLAKGAFPYLDADGRPFDDTAYADGEGVFPEVDRDAFPYTPQQTAERKVPAWLNDPTMYHNRGDSTFAGESAEQGDFVGLDDLWTERPEVVEGMEKIYQRWVRDFDIDGFRIDTVKHVDLEFWTQWATALDAYAAKQGRDDFFMFGEVYSADTAVTAPYVTQGRLDATLDFPLQDAARAYASQGASAKRLAGVFADDYRYTTDKANAYEQVSFLGNHDMGRIGHFLAADNAGASDAELLQRAKLANEVMFLSRGNPVVYYGDEQGFTGAGGDKDARQTMFASQVDDYLDDDEIGTDRTHARDAYDTGAPLYRQVADLAELRREHPALADGVQVERYAADGAGVYAFTRTDTATGREYVVALNNAVEGRTATFATDQADREYRGIHGAIDRLTSGSDRRVTVTVPPRSAVVYEAAEQLPAPTSAPTVTLSAPARGATGTVEVTADVDGATATGALDRVVFAAQVGDGAWKVLGSADHAPYKVTQALPSDLPAGTSLRYKVVVVDAAGHTASATATSATGTPPVPEVPTATSRDHAVVHYHRADGNYGDWSLYAWGDIAEGESTPWPTGHPFVGRDAYGAFAYVKLKPGAANVGFLVIDGQGTKDVASDRSIDVTKTGEVWLEQGTAEVVTQRPDTPAQDASKAVLHYHRADGAYDGWGMHVWTGAANPTDWGAPLQPVRQDTFGAVYEVPLAAGATSLSYILHKGDEKDLPSDQSLDLTQPRGHEVWLLNGVEKPLLPQVAGSAGALDLAAARAVWIDRDTVVWDGVAGAASTQLLYSRDGSITADGGVLRSDDERWLRLSRTELTDAQKATFPHLAGRTAWSVDPRDRDRVREAVRGQVVASQRNASGAVLAATGVQLAGALDDLFAPATAARLGPVFRDGRPTLSVWAPTAQSVALELGGDRAPMRRDAGTGVWSVTGPASWKGKAYRYAVTVFAPSAGKVVTNLVTDPYSVALTADSHRSLVVDLDDPALAPDGWSSLRKPAAVPLRDAQIQELHVRDFSVADSTVPAADRGTYRAFSDTASAGAKHLRALAAAGTSYVHLLPVFDIATIPERRADQATPPCDLASYAPDSEQQQECVGKAAAKDAYNWGYDPYHYTVPEGSYASDPEGTTRTREFRGMVAALNHDGLRVVMDVVYNHTSASGQAETSVLDKVVPGYYQRLLADGSIATSTCCANTAPENAMMGKLVVDSIVTWAKEYKVDGFRFDLMGHHPKANILAVRAALDALTPAKDGVDGKKIILYGEGWNFGEVADDARFVQATQRNMAGTGIATFSDRARDAVRGGGPFDEDPRVQGFASGLFTDPNDSPANGTTAEQRQRLLHDQDLIKVGLSGNLAAYRFTDSRGHAVRGDQVDYNGAPAGYAAAPGDALAYVDAHDNESLFDALTYKLPAGTAAADRARMQVLAMATATLSQGPALSQAGTDLLRSKSLDRNSYDSGDWFNAIHWSCADGNGFGRGLPPAQDNRSKWSWARPLLAAVRVRCDEIEAASAAYRDLLEIRKTEPAFSLATAAQVQDRLAFPLSGPGETPGVITMTLGDLVVVFNATPARQQQVLPGAVGTTYSLHQVQADGADAVVRTSTYDEATGTFAVPARTVAVFTRESNR